MVAIEFWYCCQVQVKWGTQNLDVDLSSTSDLATLQAQLFGLTNVPIERQKILAKGKVLKVEFAMTSLLAYVIFIVMFR